MKKIKKICLTGRMKRIMASSGGGGGGGYVLQTRIGKGGIIFPSRFFLGVQF